MPDMVLDRCLRTTRFEFELFFLLAFSELGPLISDLDLTGVIFPLLPLPVPGLPFPPPPPLGLS